MKSIIKLVHATPLFSKKQEKYDTVIIDLIKLNRP
jgi:hypothetical protein